VAEDLPLKAATFNLVAPKAQRREVVGLQVLRGKTFLCPR
jgi:hypothetical protein